MAEEDDEVVAGNDDPIGPGNEPGASTVPTEAEPEVSEAGAAAKAETSDAEPAPDVSRPGIELPAANWGVPGTLIVHHADRDIPLVFEGDAALRLIAIFAGSKNPMLSDRLDPRTSSAHSMWLAVSLTEVVAMSWIPGLPKASRPVTIDPAPPAAAA